MNTLIGAGILGLLGVIVGGAISVWGVRYAQRHQDRREKRQRVHASLRRVLLEAGVLAGVTRPWNGPAWSEDRMAEDERRAFNQALADSAEQLRQAAVDLTLEGIEEAVAAVNELVGHFNDFQWHQRRARTPGATEDSRVPAEASQAIATIRRDLDRRLPAILDDILPIGRRRRQRTWLAKRFGRMLDGEQRRA